jgi:endonuclease-3
MQTSFAFGQAADLRAIRDRLRVEFGWIRDEQRLDPVSQFIRAFLGGPAYARLRRAFANAEAIANAPVLAVETALGDARGADLKRALQKIRIRAGALNLEFLSDLDVDAALVWLEQIHGVGRHIAAATLNFSALRRRAFVVDNTVQRVLERFGFVRRNARSEEAYAAVMSGSAGLSADELYELHWNLKRLAQKTCTEDRAACDMCPLADLCMQRINEPPPVRRAA